MIIYLRRIERAIMKKENAASRFSCFKTIWSYTSIGSNKRMTILVFFTRNNESLSQYWKMIEIQCTRGKFIVKKNIIWHVKEATEHKKIDVKEGIFYFNSIMFTSTDVFASASWKTTSRFSLSFQFILITTAVFITTLYRSTKGTLQRVNIDFLWTILIVPHHCSFT